MRASVDFCGHSIGGEEKRTIRISGARERSKRSAPLNYRQVPQRPERRRRFDRHGPQVNEHHEEHVIIIDDHSSLSLPAEHREPHLKTDARISTTQDGVRGTNCGARSSKSSAADQISGDGKRLSTAAQQQSGRCEQKTIETAVFIDQALDNKFNGLSNGLVELNKLVLTIMNQVQHLFRYSSLKVPIRIKLVLVEHMRDSERQGIAAPNPERGDIDAYLSNFCNWQQARLERERRIWWDHAILLSG